MFKRPYLMDYNKSRGYVSVGNFTIITLTGVSSALVQSQKQIDVYLEEINNEEKYKNNPLKKYESQLKKKIIEKKLLNNLKYNLLRSNFVNLIRYFYEYLSVNYLSNRIADKLTKNLDASAYRKLKKFNKVIVFEKLILTSYRRNLLNSLSFYTIDSIIEFFKIFYNYEIFSYFMDKSVDNNDSNSSTNNNKNNQKLQLKSKFYTFFIKLLHRGIFLNTSLLYSSIGYSIGSVLINPSFGGLIFSLGVDMGLDIIFRPIILKFLPPID